MSGAANAPLHANRAPVDFIDMMIRIGLETVFRKNFRKNFNKKNLNTNLGKNLRKSSRK